MCHAAAFHQVSCAIKMNLLGFECIQLPDPKRRNDAPAKVLAKFPINELVLTKSKGKIACLVSKAMLVHPTGYPGSEPQAVNSLFVMTAASPEAATWMCSTAVELRAVWDDHVKQIILHNFTEAQVSPYECGVAPPYS